MLQTPSNLPVEQSAKPSDGTAGAISAGSVLSVPESAGDEPDPLANLYKMSRTAGLGSGDYVAVNPIAVTALVFGIAGALVVVDSLFIIIPLVGLILGIMAFKQVRQSNGTQTGGAMAGVAIFLSLAFLGAKVGKEGLASLRMSADRKEIESVVEVFGQHVAALDPSNASETNSQLAAAYDLFDEEFKSRVTSQHFDQLWVETWTSPYYGPMISMHSNGLLKFDTDAKSGDPVCTSVVIAEFKRGESSRWTMTFRQLNGKWYIEDMPEVFPTAQPGGKR
jgi:hypothetical protein